MVRFRGKEFDDVRTNEYGEDEYLWDGQWMTADDMDAMDFYLNEYVRDVRRANGDADDPDFDYEEDDEDDYEDDYEEDDDE